jgi:hypothetical protein
MTSILKVDTLQDASGTGTPYIKDAVLQVKNFQTGALNSGTENIPWDNTIPQITEGKEYMTLSITPKSSLSKLFIEVIVNGSRSTSGDSMVALFVGTTVDALAVSNIYAESAERNQFAINYFMTSGTTSELTFRVRAGGHAGTFTFNGHSGTGVMGGTLMSSITITEIGG